MSQTTKARGAALGRVCRLVVAAERHGQAQLDVEEVKLALEGVDVEGLATPRPCPVHNAVRPFGITGVTTHTQGQA